MRVLPGTPLIVLVHVDAERTTFSGVAETTGSDEAIVILMPRANSRSGGTFVDRFARGCSFHLGSLVFSDLGEFRWETGDRENRVAPLMARFKVRRRRFGLPVF